ncbi:hypothetical protein [Sulfitobacter sp. 1A15106]|uniref:hypothetical protein n=1 Tax=Sulfitobacter sp. 1A15106 TaxID=3368590 RepID=UPI0037460114
MKLVAKQNIWVRKGGQKMEITAGQKFEPDDDEAKTLIRRGIAEEAGAGEAAKAEADEKANDLNSDANKAKAQAAPAAKAGEKK